MVRLISSLAGGAGIPAKDARDSLTIDSYNRASLKNILVADA
jgi:hypothetical protein